MRVNKMPLASIHTNLIRSYYINYSFQTFSPILGENVAVWSINVLQGLPYLAYAAQYYMYSIKTTIK